MPEKRDYDLAIYKVPRKDKNGNDITGDKVGSGGRHRGDGTYSGVAYDPEILDEEAERRLSGPVRYEDLSPVGQIFVDGFEIAFTKLMDYASDCLLEGFDNWLYNRRQKKEAKRRDEMKKVTEKVRKPMTKAESILQEERVKKSTSVAASRINTIIMPDEFDIAHEQYSANMTSEEAQKELLDAFILYVLAVKKLNKVAHAKVIDSDENITDGRSMIDKISAPVVIEKINNILEHNPGLLEEWQTIALSDILGGALIKEDKLIPINGEKLLQGLLYHNQESRNIGCKK